MSKKHHIAWLLPMLAMLLTGCSMTKNIPEDEQLFTGLKKIVYLDDDSIAVDNDEISEVLITAKEEIEAALATKPNGSLFGSSYYSVPWSWRLWVYNKYSKSDSRLARWITKTLGRSPVLMSQVNPALRASVANSVLRSNGFFRGDVSYETINSKNPKKAKIAYTVRLDSLFTLDSIAYTNFPASMRKLVDSTAIGSYIHKGTPFTVNGLENERNRISTLFRNNGYYYFHSDYMTYLADTLQQPNKAQLQLRLADGLQQEAFSQWYIGNVKMQIRRNQQRTAFTDSLQIRHLKFLFSGKHSPVRPRVALKGLRLFPRQLFSYEKYLESVSKMNGNGVFSSMDFQFTPRHSAPSALTVPGGLAAGIHRQDTVPAGFASGNQRQDTQQRDTLDLTINCVLDKPYDFYFEATAIGRTIGRYGPEAKLGLVRRNAFRGAEKLDINVHGSYEWNKSGNSSKNTFQYGADASIEFPRIIAPFYNSDRRRSVRRDTTRTARRTLPRRFFSSPVTIAKMSTDIVRRPDYYKMHIVTGEWTYRWQTSEQNRHEFSPLTLKYQYLNTRTEIFDSILSVNPYLTIAMEDYFIPKMRYSYVYTSPTTLHHPIRWELTLEESGNLVALWDVLGGHGWNEEDKTLFKNPYSQFLRFETDLTKTWRTGNNSSLVGHVNMGLAYAYGNSFDMPFSEMFYAGGANSIRAFPVRGVGPAEFGGLGDIGSRQFSYVLQNGDMKLVANLEYRPRLFGNLEGALFVDMGNVWLRKIPTLSYEELESSDYTAEQKEMVTFIYEQLMLPMKFKASRFFNQIAVGTGVGLRYDLGFLVLRLDWGVALHTPYNTGKSGYFNINRFSDAQTLHFAIGYPF